MSTNIHPQHLTNIPPAILEGLDPRDLGLTFGVSFVREDGPVVFFYHGFTFTEQPGRRAGAHDKYAGQVGRAPDILGMVDIITRLEEETPRPYKAAALPCDRCLRTFPHHHMLSTVETMEITR